jgi:hypothetical protein
MMIMGSICGVLLNDEQPHSLKTSWLLEKNQTRSDPLRSTVFEL